MKNNINPPATGDSGNPGNNNKLWYIVGSVLVVGILWWMLSGMFARNAAERAFEAATGGQVQYEADGTATYSNEEGSVTVGGGSYPSNWPQDAPQYPGGVIQYSGSSNPQTGEPGAAVMFQVGATVQTVVDYYQQQLTAKGWTVDAVVSMGAASSISAIKGEATFGAYITDVGDGNTAVTAAVSGL